MHRANPQKQWGRVKIQGVRTLMMSAPERQLGRGSRPHVMARMVVTIGMVGCMIDTARGEEGR